MKAQSQVLTECRLGLGTVLSAVKSDDLKKKKKSDDLPGTHRINAGLI